MCQRASLRKRTWLFRLRDVSPVLFIRSWAYNRCFRFLTKAVELPDQVVRPAWRTPQAQLARFLLSRPRAELLINDTNTRRALHRSDKSGYASKPLKLYARLTGLVKLHARRKSNAQVVGSQAACMQGSHEGVEGTRMELLRSSDGTIKS